MFPDLLLRLLRSRRLQARLVRWRAGHQMFIEVDQILLVILHDLRQALVRRDWARAEDRFRLAAQMFLASAATLHFTGDLGAGAFEELVVPDMVAYYPDPGMSGSNIEEHLLLIRLVRGITRDHQDAIRNAPGRVWDAYQMYTHARSAALDAHRDVCRWSAKHRGSLASRTSQPADEKLAEMAVKERQAMHIERAGTIRPGECDDPASMPAEAVTDAAPGGRILDVAIQARSNCPIASFLRMIERLKAMGRPGGEVPMRI